MSTQGHVSGPHSDDWRKGGLWLSPDLYDALSARPDWQALVDATTYRNAGWCVRLFLRLAGASAVTINGCAYVLVEDWLVQDHAVAALAVHESVHAEQERELGWWRFLCRYVGWRVTHPRTPIQEHPLEQEAYRVEEAVGALLNQG